MGRASGCTGRPGLGVCPSNTTLLRKTICSTCVVLGPKQSRPPHHLGGAHKHGATYSSHRAPSTYSSEYASGFFAPAASLGFPNTYAIPDCSPNRAFIGEANGPLFYSMRVEWRRPMSISLSVGSVVGVQTRPSSVTRPGSEDRAAW